jgi:hypothetical protein
MFNLHKPSEEEKRTYEEILYPVQDKILKAIGLKFDDAFYLTGGTALSRFYFHHRLSEDLDLFTAEENIKTALPIIVREIENLGYSVEVECSSVSFGRLYVQLDRETKLKIDLVADYPLKNPVFHPNGFFLDTLKNIAVNKITAFEDRAELKDLVDLYFIVKEGGINVQEILDLADRKRVPIPYEELLAVNTTGLTGKVLLLKEINEKDLEAFLNYLKGILEENIKKKVQEAEERIEEIVRDLLWDFPREERKLNEETAPVLLRRVRGMSYPVRKVLLQRLVPFCRPSALK